MADEFEDGDLGSGFARLNEEDPGGDSSHVEGGEEVILETIEFKPLDESPLLQVRCIC